jgi:hypothetical protein
MIKDVIRLKWEAQLSHDKIATALGISKGVVQKYLALARAASRHSSSWTSSPASARRSIGVSSAPSLWATRAGA